MDDYVYDANGNMTSDLNKGITNIDYNHLNLLTEVVFDNNPNKKITYIYDATGIKQKEHFLNTVIAWFGHVEQFANKEGGIHLSNIIDFHAVLNPENRKKGRNKLEELVISSLESFFTADNRSVTIVDGDNIKGRIS